MKALELLLKPIILIVLLVGGVLGSLYDVVTFKKPALTVTAIVFAIGCVVLQQAMLPVTIALIVVYGLFIK